MHIPDVTTTTRLVAQDAIRGYEALPFQDYRSSLMQAAPEGNGSWLNTVKNWVLFIPRSIWHLLKGTISFLSCRKLCKNTLTVEEKRAVIQGVLDIWKGGGTALEKGQAWAAMGKQYPDLVEEMLAVYAKVMRDAELGDKSRTDSSKIKSWNEAYLENAFKAAIERIKDCDVSFLEGCLKFLTP